MNFSSVPVSRRSFLRGAGVIAALPFLESLAPTQLRGAMKVPVKPPLRFGIYTVTGGTVSESWVPSTAGPLGKLPSILRSLEENKSEILILSNLSHAGESDGKINGHEHCAFLHLTGASRVGKTDGKAFASQSVDQRAAEILGEQSMIPSLQMGYAGGETTFFFDRNGQNLSVERDPLIAFERMFNGRSLVAPNWGRRATPLPVDAVSSGPRNYDEKVIDLVLEDANRLQRQIGYSDRGKLEEYLESVSSIERRAKRLRERIAIEMRDLKDPGPSNPHAPERLPEDRKASHRMTGALTQNPAIHGDYLALMTDLMVLAFQTDTTRVCSLGLGSDEALFPGVVTVGYENHAHTLEHHGNAQRVEDADPVAREGCRQIHAWYTQYFARAVAKMKSIDEGGSSLLDNTVLLNTSYMSNGQHGRGNYPVLLAGRAGGTLNTGRHLAYQEDTPMANLFVEILDRLGDSRGEFGDSRTSTKAAYDGRLTDLG